MKLSTTVMAGISLASVYLLSTSLMAECEVNAELRNSPNNQYDVFAFQPSVQTYTLTVLRTDISGDACEASVTIKSLENVLSNTSNGRLNYTLTPGSIDMIIQNDSLVLSLPALITNEATEISFQMEIPADQLVTAGSYSDELTVLINEGINADGSILLDEKVDVQTQVESTARIGVLGSEGRTHRLDFGELTSGKRLTPVPQIRVLSTNGFKITFESDNRGFLRHESSNTQWDISYQARFGDQVINLEQADFELNFPLTGAASERRFPLELTVQEVGEKPAGVYEDVIYVEVSPVGF